jgi:ketosteroid isomerase-like protein
MSAHAESVVREFWRLMATNDFASVKAVLSPHFILEGPQSNERIRGAGNFARMNAEYPTTTGQWRFTINHLVAQGSTVVTQVSVTDGEQGAEAISFFTVDGGQITHVLEFWPEPYAAPTNRLHLTEPIA